MVDVSQLRFGRYILVIIVLVAICRSGVATKPKCPKNFLVVSLQDARDAAYASRYVYLKTKENVQMPNRRGYYVTDIIELPLVRGETVKVLVADEGNNRIIAFRGTISARQLGQQFVMGLMNLRKKRHISVYDSKQRKKKRVVALGFIVRAYETLKRRLAEHMNDKELRYIITGHSLGGAIASLFSLMTKKEHPNVWNKPGSCLITFGAPRVGGKEYADLHDQEISPKRKIRFVNKLDIAPHVPYTPNIPRIQRFKHHSREVWLATPYLVKKATRGKTCRKKWWRWRCTKNPDNTAAWKVCNDGDDAGCSNKKKFRDYNARDHSMKNYIAQLKKVPAIIYDKYNKEHKDGNEKTRWDAAMYCSNNGDGNKRSTSTSKITRFLGKIGSWFGK